MDSHEEKFIAAFVKNAYRERCIAKKGLPRKDLWHVLPSKLDARHTLELPKNVRRPDRVLVALRRLHPVETGFCISAHSEIDGTTIEMDDFGDRDGTIVSFIAGKLAHYQSEHGLPTFQCLLVRDAALKRNAGAVLEAVSAEYRRADARD